MCDNPCRSIQLGAVVDLHLAVEGYSRQCHCNQIMEELKRSEQVLLPLL